MMVIRKRNINSLLSPTLGRWQLARTPEVNIWPAPPNQMQNPAPGPPGTYPINLSQQNQRAILSPS